MPCVPGTNQSRERRCGWSASQLPSGRNCGEVHTSAVKVEDNTPYCSLCKADNHTKAVKFCTTCAVFYCQECLANCHPMRGALKRHQLISSMEYLSQETSQGQVIRDHPSTGQPSCARHGQPFVLYCEPCGMVMCMGCVVEHPGHAMRDIPSAAGNVKLAVLCKTSELEKVLRETKESLPGVMRLQNKIQKNQELHFQEVEKAYCAALESLQAWRQQSIDGIKTRYSQWCVECNAILKHFQLQAQEMERMVQASKDFLASMDVEFLQGSTSFTKTIGDQLNEIRANLERHEVSKQNLQGFVQLDLVLPRHVTVKETVQRSQDLEAAVGGQMSRPKPTLIFTRTNNRKLRITDSGSVIEGDFLEGESGRAVTNGRYQTGRYYWEIEITCSRVCGSGCDVEVTQESCGVRGRTDPGHNSWYIGMLCRGDEVRCYSHRGGEIKPGYLQGRRYTRPLRMGLYLNCDDQSLTVLDCHNNQVIGTVSGVVVTEPLVPWVEFYVWSGSMSASGSVSARLVTGDCSSASSSQ